MRPAELKPWAKNPRKNDDAAITRVCESIKRFGFGAPIVARAHNREIIAGHTRWLAAQRLELAHVPVRLLDISDADAHVLAVADNRYVELGAWSDDAHEYLASLEAIDLAIAGWSPDDLAKLTAAALPSNDDVEANKAGMFGVFDCEQVAAAHYERLKIAKLHDFALSLGDTMVEINRCAAGGQARATITDAWFPHRYDVRCGHSPQTPNESIHDRVAVAGTCKLLSEHEQWPTRAHVVRALSLYRGRQTARQFPPHIARDVYRQCARADSPRVLDPCAGWGGRLLGWLASRVGGHYVGFDASAATCASFTRMIDDLQIRNAQVQHAAFEDVELERSSFDIAFTSPPYFSTERYSDDAEQSYVRYPTYQAWRDGFLAQLIHKTLDALKPDAALVLNVSDAGKHEIATDAIALARAAGAHVERSEKIDVGAGSVGGLNTAESISEDLIVLRKGA